MFPGYNDSVKKIAKKIFFIIRAGSEIPALLPFLDIFLPNALHGLASSKPCNVFYCNYNILLKSILYSAQIHKGRKGGCMFKQPCGSHLKIVIGLKKIFTGGGVYKGRILGVIIVAPAAYNCSFWYGDTLHDVKTGNNRFVPVFRHGKKGF
jgi:hypothetical protein